MFTRNKPHSLLLLVLLLQGCSKCSGGDSVAAPPAVSSAPAPLSYQAGQVVEAPWGGSFYTATIQEVHDNGTCHLVYEDGDTADLPLTELRRFQVVDAQTPLPVGTQVRVKVGAIWSEATVQEILADQTVRVRYTEDDTSGVIERANLHL